MISTVAPPATAQEGPSLLELLRPENLVQRVVQTGVMMLRTQMDLTYSDMSVWLGGGRISMTDIRMWPLPDWDGGGDCQIQINRLTTKGVSADVVDRYEMRLSAFGATASLACLPPDMRTPLTAAGLEAFDVPDLSLRMTYDIPSGGATLSLDGELRGLASLSATAQFPYLWIDGRSDMEEPVPVVFLSRADLTLEDLGAWERFGPLIPEPFRDPASAPMALEGLLGTALAGMNRAAAKDGETASDPSALGPAQRAFLDSAIATWSSFLGDPGRLVLETTLDPEAHAFVDFEAYEADPRRLFEDLGPRLATRPATAHELVPLDLLRAARSADPSTLSEDQRLDIGTALLTGRGAPRDIASGTALLTALAAEGNGLAALQLAQSLLPQDPEAAYRHALLAGKTGYTGGTSLLDRIEKDLPLARVLAIQAEASVNDSHALDALDSLPSIRAEARARLTGRGLTRSYAIAAMWATLAAAAGDAEGAAILAELDERARLANADAAALWSAQLAAASDLAMHAWIEEDVPGRLGLTR